jgi:hypothetical protein
MGDAVGQVLADARAAVVNVSHDVFGQLLSCRRWLAAGAVTFRLLRWSGAGECGHSCSRRGGTRTGLAWLADRWPDLLTRPCSADRRPGDRTTGLAAEGFADGSFFQTYLELD